MDAEFPEEHFEAGLVDGQAMVHQEGYFRDNKKENRTEDQHNYPKTVLPMWRLRSRMILTVANRRPAYRQTTKEETKAPKSSLRIPLRGVVSVFMMFFGGMTE